MKKIEASKKDSRLEKVVVFLLVVLISLLSFSVGVISGKGLSDKEYALKTIDQKNSHALTDDTADAPAEGDLSEEEIQQLANAAIQAAEKNGDAKVVADDASEAAEIAELEKKAGGKTTTAAKTAEPAAVASEKKEEERFPTSVKKGSIQAEYTVQVAAYPNPKDAEAMSATLLKKGLPAFPIKVMVNGAEWYKVSVGSFKNRKEAMDYQAELKKQGLVKDAFVQKITK
ncbi:SPOR domain-containing protein [bacterium]|nr:SPOR domain-containing protein [bacterium]